MMRKRILTNFVMGLSLATVVAFSAFAYGDAVKSTPFDETVINASLNATGAPDHLTLTWSDDPTTTQTITWRTNTDVNIGEVKFKKASDSAYTNFELAKQSVFESNASDATSKGKMNIFTANIKNLTPGTKYTYIVGDGANWSEENTFTTEAKNTTDFKFLIFGDSQSGNSADPNYAPWHDTITKAYSQNKDAKFLVNMGDLVEIGHYYTHWNSWFNAAKGVIDNIPDMVVQGNHETYVEDKNWSCSKPDYYTNQFNVFQNGPDGLKGQTYSYDYGNAHIIVLDSQETEESATAKGPDILKPQQEWLEKDLAAHKDAKWKFVFFHKTPYYNKSVRANVQISKAFTPIFDKYHVDVVFNGHDHGVSRTYPIKDGEMVQNPSEGTVYYVTGRSGNKYYNDLTSKVWDANFYDPQDEPCYETVQIKDGALTISSFKQDGTLIDKYVIDKDNVKNTTINTLPGKFNKPRLVVYGTSIVLGKLPTVVDGKAYVDLAYIAELIGAKYDSTAMTLGMTDDDGNQVTYTFTKDDFTKDGISIDTLNKVAGFDNKYDTQFNMVMIEK
jgi:hypothetical protein